MCPGAWDTAVSRGQLSTDVVQNRLMHREPGMDVVHMSSALSGKLSPFHANRHTVMVKGAGSVIWPLTWTWCTISECWIFSWRRLALVSSQAPNLLPHHGRTSWNHARESHARRCPTHVSTVQAVDWVVSLESPSCLSWFVVVTKHGNGNLGSLEIAEI